MCIRDSGRGHLLGLPDLEVQGIHIGREDADVPLAKIVNHLLRLPERGKAEERCSRLSERCAHGAHALLDLVFGLIGRQLREVSMRPRVRADRVSGLRSESVAAFDRIGWPPSVGISGRLASDSVLITGHGPSKRTEIFYFTGMTLAAVRIGDFKCRFTDQSNG